MLEHELKKILKCKFSSTEGVKYASCFLLLIIFRQNSDTLFLFFSDLTFRNHTENFLFDCFLVKKT